MPYSTVDDLPQSVKDRIKSPKKRRQWLHVWNSEYKRHHDEGRAFASANSVVSKAAGMTDTEARFSFFLPLAKVDKEKRTVSGYASTECVDCDGEIVSRDAIKAALPGYMVWKNIREMHQPSAVGKATEANMDGKGLYLTAKIVDDAAWKKVEEDVYKGFSIGGRKLAKSGNTITKLDLIEVSLVDRPANPECAITVQKNAKVDGAEAYLLPAPKTSSRDREALKKMAEVVDILADEPTPEELEKREFDAKERESAAESGAALPDGSFPIKNKKDLENARQAVGRAKNPGKARAHIRARAAALGVKLPDSWSKKLGKRLVAEAEKEVSKSASAPSSMILDAGGGAEAAEDKIGFSHGPSLEEASPSLLHGDGGLTKRERKLLKRMGVAASLSYCFDSIRDAQRSLMYEAQREGGDQKDKALADKLGTIAQNLAGVIGQKAEHEGREALDFSDADDVGMMSILGNGDIAMTVDTRNEPDALSKMILGLVEKSVGKDTPPAKSATSVGGILKAAQDEMKSIKKARKDVEECVKAAFEMCKMGAVRKAALKKAGKNDDDADDKPAEVMKMLQKAFGALQTQKAHTKAASASIAKAAGCVEDSVGGVYEVPDGVKTISPSEMDNLPANKAGFVSRSEVDALLKAAAAEAENALLKSMPAQNGQKPYAFDVTKVGLGGGKESPVGDFFKGANPANLASDNATLREAEIAKAIGNQILGSGGKMIFDPAFHGTAGAS